MCFKYTHNYNPRLQEKVQRLLSNSYLLVVVVFIFYTWYHSPLEFGEIKMRLHWKRKDDRICTLGGKPHPPMWKEIQPEHSPGFLGERSLGPLSMPWEQSPSRAQSPEPHHCPLVSTPTGHSLTANKTISDAGFSSNLNGFLLRINYFWVKSAKVLIAAPKGVEEATVQSGVRLILRYAYSYLDEIKLCPQ